MEEFAQSTYEICADLLAVHAKLVKGEFEPNNGPDVSKGYFLGLLTATAYIFLGPNYNRDEETLAAVVVHAKHYCLAFNADLN